MQKSRAFLCPYFELLIIIKHARFKQNENSFILNVAVSVNKNVLNTKLRIHVRTALNSLKLRSNRHITKLIVNYTSEHLGGIINLGELDPLSCAY